MPTWERSHEHKLYRMVSTSFNLIDVTFFFLINMIDLLLICSFECDLKTLAGHLLVTRQVCQVLIFPLLSIGCYT